jgi:HemY protein
MIRVAFYLAGVLAFTAGLHWLAKRPGTITIEWMGHIAEISVLGGLVLLATLLAVILLAWSLLRRVWRSPAVLARYLNRRRQQRGLDALSGGIIAVGAGDRSLAQRYAAQARKSLPHEPLTLLLRAQAAQLGGDRATARRIFEAMLAAPDTEQLGLHGLFLEAEREGERVAARQYAERALRLNPKLGWPVDALFDLYCRAGDWQGALTALGVAERQHLIDKPQARRRRALLLAAEAQALEDGAPDKALDLGLEAHRLARDLVPAAAVAGRILAARGRTPQAARVLLRTWRHAPHPDLAVAYAYARPGDSPRDRLDRVRYLARLTPGHAEALIAVATSAIDARAWDEARDALKPLLDSGRITARVCALMARIEGEQYGDVGRVREWLTRAVGAERDPAWVADGIVYERWSPVSPATGRLDAMRWEVPAAGPSERAAATALAAKLESMLGLSAAGSEQRVVIEAPSAGAPATPVPPPVAAPVPPPAPIVSPPIAAPITAEPAPATLPPPARPPSAATTPVMTPRADVGDAVVGDVPTVPAGPVPATRPRKPAEPKIFIPPRAPDDPGTSDLDDLQGYPTKA